MVHKVNFVCAKVIAHSVLKTIFGAFRSEQPRHICGPFRTLTWVAKNFKHTPVDNHKITEDRIKNSQAGSYASQMTSTMWFPHMYNKEENYNPIIPHLPPKYTYLYKSLLIK